MNSSKEGDNEPQRSITPMQQMISSCSGALVTSLLVTPLDVIKIRLQAQHSPIGPGSAFIYNNGLMDHVCICSHCAENGSAKAKQWFRRSGQFSGTLQYCAGDAMNCNVAAEWFRRSGQFNGTLDAMVKIVRFEGVSSLWSGLPPTLVMAIPATVIYFTSYDQIKYKMGYNELDPSTKYIPPVAGVIARTGAVIMISPLELIRTKMQSQQQSYRELATAIRNTMKECGAQVLLRGLGPTLLRDVPFSAMYWFGYEYFKALQLQGSSRKVPTFTESFLAGGISGSIAAMVTLPFDVIKTHRQIELGKGDFCKDQKVTSTWRLIGQLYQQSGIKALFAGAVPRVVKVAPACAIMISTYEFSKSFFRRYNSQNTVKDWT